VERGEVSEAAPPKPRWRGRIHRGAFFVAVPAGVVLILVAPTLKARLAVTIYAISLAAMYGVSGAYHTVPWSPPALRRMKQLDHSMIFLLIAGTYTPFSLLVLHGAWAVGLLVAAWVGAAVGIGLKLARIDGLHVVTGALYIILGWLAVLSTPQIVKALSLPALLLLLAGGLMYTTGAIVLATRRPNPSPSVFGYHEIWHTLTIGAGACHYLVIMSLVLSLR
jgi:hemolysin III